MSKSLKALLESWSDEFSARANRIRWLIGDAHWLSDGMHKERLLQAFVDERLPRSLAAGHGFLLDPSSDSCSRELDVLVRDCMHSPPLLEESGITICHPQAARAYVEVKSVLRADSLSAALALIAESQQLISASAEPSHVWRGICFADAEDGRTNESLLQTLLTKLKETCDAITAPAGRHADYLPVCIICVDRFCAFIGSAKNGARCRVRFFPLGRLSFAVGFADMLSHVYAHSGIRATQPLDQSVEQVVEVTPSVTEV